MAIVRFFILAALICSSLVTHGNGSPDPDDARFRYFIRQYLSTSEDSASWKGLSDFAERLSAKRQAVHDDYSFLKLLYARVHTKFLKEYAAYPSFAEILSEGRYDCLTGVAVYALLLDRFQYDYEVVETNYHIFLLVTTARGIVLLEATDPVDGLVTGTEAIEERISEYRRAGYDPPGNTGTEHHAFAFDLYRSVTLQEITGLLYFNLAVDAFNRGDIETSLDLIQAASLHYQSERIEEFSRLILQRAAVTSGQAAQHTR